MIRALFFLIKVAVLIAIAAWVAERPGTVTFEWLDIKVTMQIGLFLVIALGVMLLALFLFRILWGLANLPASLARYRQHMKGLKGHRALTLGLTAVAAGDSKGASYQAYRALALLPEEEQGLALLLKAQSCRLQGQEEEAVRHFEKLLRRKDTAFLGVRGLLQTALDSKNYAEALSRAREALRLHPKQPWILLTTYRLEIHLRLFDSALKTLYRAEKAGAVDKDKAQSDRIAMLLYQAEKYMDAGLRSDALKALEKAYKFDPCYLPSVLRLAQYHIKNENRRRAVNVIEKAWRKNTHPDLVPLWGAAMTRKAQANPLERLKWFERLLALKPQSSEGQMAAARAAMDNGLWGEARNYLKMAEKIRSNPRLYRLYAELERHTSKDERLAAEWIEKAVDAPPERRWIRKETGKIYENWSAIAEPHGAFNTIVWDFPHPARTPLTLRNIAGLAPLLETS